LIKINQVNQKKEKKNMKTKAVRLYGVNDLRLEEFELPPIKDDEILAHIVSDSVCMSSHKAAIQGPAHKRVPNDVAENPIIIGHEFCGELIEVGAKWKDQFKPGDKFTIQPALNYKGSLDAPGYSYKYIGGDATYVIIPNEVMEMGCLLKYTGDAYFYGSLAEPVSCVVGAFRAQYHTKSGSYVHEMGIVPGGCTAILAGAGPMGLGAIDYALHCDRKPRLLVVTDIDEARLQRAAEILSPESAAEIGVELHYVNTGKIDDPVAYLKSLTGGEGYNDVFVFAPVRPVVEMGDKLLARDGCLNFFAGPTNPDFTAELNFYNVHYASTHIVGTSGGNTDDMIESLEMMSAGKINPAAMITHIGGLDSVADTIINLPNIKGGKKLIYTNKSMPLVAIEDFEKLGQTDKFYAELAEIMKRSNNLWCAEAERYVLENAKDI
jgi:threonine dehydrogenase-like Zn-dependent dehydrogenase